MEQQAAVERLIKFGLTRQEAVIYLALYQEEMLTGYEASKLTGISRSNTYSGLAGLVDKGAAYIIDGAVKKYIAVPLDEFCRNRIRRMETDQAFLLEHIPKTKARTEGYITIEGYTNILDKMINMLQQAEQRVYLSMSSKLFQQIKAEIEQLAAKGLRVVVITDQELHLNEAEVYLTEEKGSQFRLIVDSAKVLTGELDQKRPTCLYSGQMNLVTIMKEALRNEIQLITLKKGEL